ncbi:MAG: antibiotic biosynthesis monooxygenase family protein [Minicystis sp.]
MVIEYIRYRIDGGSAASFEAAYQRASASLRASPHCLGYDLARCAEDASVYVLRIQWDSAQGHLEGFRRSPEFQPFLEAVRPFLSSIEEMRHYQPTTIQFTR